MSMSGERPCVLLVDDVEANLVALDALLCDLDCELVRARGGNEALRELLHREFAVMLLDVQMPEIDGYEVARYARENPITRDVPIIFLTANSNGDDSRLRGYGSGAVDYLRKPLEAPVLRAKVRVFLDLYLGRKRLRDEVEAHRQTSHALEQANLALRHFTNAASHDLRAPLRAVRGFLDALDELTHDQLQQEARDYLERSRRAAARMDSLLSSLLVYAGLRKASSPAQVDLNAVMQHVQTDLAMPIAEAGARVSVSELPTIFGDSDRLYQLFLNLVSNAIKFRRPGVTPQINVTANVTRAELRVCVEDNGIGIEAPDQDLIFDAFSRVYSQSQYEGNGLGLQICKQIVEQHGGRLWVESKPGEGSCFHAAFPRTNQGVKRR